MKVNLQYDRISQPTASPAPASQRASSFAQTMSMIADEKTSDRAVASEHRLKREATEKKPLPPKTSDAPAATNDEGAGKDMTRPLPVAQHPGGGTREQNVNEEETGQTESGFRSATEQVTSGRQPAAVSVSPTGDQSTAPVQAASSSVADTAAGADDDASADDAGAVGAGSDEGDLDASTAGSPVSGQPGFALSFPGAVNESEPTAPSTDAAAAGLVTSANPQNPKAATNGKEVTAVDAKHKAMENDAIAPPAAATPISAIAAAGSGTAGQHGSAQSGDHSQALQQAVQNVSNAAASGGTSFQAASRSDSSASASSQASPTPTAAETAEMSSAKTAISTSQLIQSMHQSEMRVGMNSAEFGHISISTSLSHQLLSASISLGHPELGRALALHMPAMEAKLSDTYGVQARLEMREGNDGSSQGGHRQARDGQPSNRTSKLETGSDSGTVSAGMAVLPITPTTLAANSMRLDVLY